MDLAHYNLTITPTGLPANQHTQYVREVHEHLRWIHRTTSGRILLNVLRTQHGGVHIRPYLGVNCNAIGGGSEDVFGNRRGTVQYSPKTFSIHGNCNHHPAESRKGMLWDEILFHELVHAFRAITGKWNTAAPLSVGMIQYDDNEEFVAGLCTNIYISDRTNKIKSGLRAGHRGFGGMNPDDARRFGLFTSSKNAFKLVKNFCADNPIFTKALSDKLADVEYNPIADYYRYPEFCEMLSIAGAIKDFAAIKKSLMSAGMPETWAAQIATWMISL